MSQDVRNRVAETVIVVAVLVAAWFVLGAPFQERAERLGARVRALRGELESFKATSDLPPEQARVYVDRVERLLSVAAPRSTLAEHERILGLARRSGLSVDRINPIAEEAPVRIGPLVTGSRRFQIETVGSYAQLAAFLSALSTQAPMSVVDHLAISAASPDDPDRLILTAGVKVGRVSTQHFDVAEVGP